ncbi:MAG: hypothetical protein NVSMB21_11200 [Vulcanimicrobiaceae bacterium]
MRDWIEACGTSTYHGPLVLLGFSAGMMMAGALLHDEPTRYAGAVLLSGALDDAALGSPGALASVPIFYGSGALDAVIPHDLATRTLAHLRGSGAPVTVREYPIGHSISNAELADIGAWLDATV